MSSKKKTRPVVTIPAAEQLILLLDEALATGSSIDILPSSHFAVRVKDAARRIRESL